MGTAWPGLYFQLLPSHVLLHGNLVPPQSVLVIVCEGVDHYGDGQGEDEGSCQSTKPSQEFSREGLRGSEEGKLFGDMKYKI